MLPYSIEKMLKSVVSHSKVYFFLFLKFSFFKFYFLFKIRKYPPVPYCQASVIVSIGFVVLILLLVGARGTSNMFPK